MKIYKIKCSGYKRIKDNFEISFIAPKGNKLPQDNEELTKEGDYCYFNTATLFIGRNCSGKSTVLELIELCYLLLENGRVAYKKDMFCRETIDLEIQFLVENILYKYNCKLKHAAEIVTFNTNYCMITNQKIYEKVLYRKGDIDDERRKFREINVNIPSNIDSYSIIKSIKFRPQVCLTMENQTTSLYQLIVNFLNAVPFIGEEVSSSILNIFDYNILSANLINYIMVKILFMDGTEYFRPVEDFLNFVTYGSIRGCLLLAYSVLAIKTGATLIVDDLDISLDQSFIRGIYSMFYDKSINKKQSSLIVSTHNPRLLDCTKLVNNIHFVKKNNNGYIELIPFSSFSPSRVRVANSKLFDDIIQVMVPKKTKVTDLVNLVRDSIN